MRSGRAPATAVAAAAAAVASLIGFPFSHTSAAVARTGAGPTAPSAMRASLHLPGGRR